MLKKIIFMFAAVLTLTALVDQAQAQDMCNSSAECGENQVCMEDTCVQNGNLAILAFWEVGTDVDLHVVTPSGTEISPDIADTRRADGGRMVRDSCYGDNCTEPGNYYEQIAWNTCAEPPSGEYRVWVENYNGNASATVNLRVLRPDGSIQSLGSVLVSGTERDKSRVLRFDIEPPEPVADGECVRDTDGDGLCDDWEICGIDVDNDGEIDWEIPGANPNKKDLYVEVDYQTGNDEFSDGTSSLDVIKGGISDTISAFAAAPVEGADGVTGINLHVTLDDEFDTIGADSISQTDEIGKEHLNQLMFGTDSVDEETNSCQGGWFGTEEDRESPDCEKIIKAKRKVYRYGVSVYKRPGTGSSGRASGIPGTAFLVSIGSWGSYFNQPYYGGTFMHEFGHTLNLRHGGHENFNCKVNYLSVMSYLYQLTGRYPGRNLDFSREKLPDLDPSNLDEAKGIQGPADWGDVIFGHEGRLTLSGYDASEGIDYDQNGDREGEGLSASIAHFSTVCDRDGNLSVNESHDDWGNLTYAPASFDGHITGASDQGDAESHEEEMTLEQAIAIEDEIDDDVDDVPGSADNCLGIPNGDQADRDSDGVGDACDACPTIPARGMSDGCPYSGGSWERFDDQADVSKDDLPDVPDTDFVTPSSGGCSTASSPATAPFGLILLALISLRRRRRNGTRAA